MKEGKEKKQGFYAKQLAIKIIATVQPSLVLPLKALVVCTKKQLAIKIIATVQPSLVLPLKALVVCTKK